MPRRDEYMYFILLYIVLGEIFFLSSSLFLSLSHSPSLNHHSIKLSSGLAITTMCIDLVGVQYIRKIHYFGRKIQDARSALAVVGGKVIIILSFSLPVSLPLCLPPSLLLSLPPSLQFRDIPYHLGRSRVRAVRQSNAKASEAKFA